MPSMEINLMLAGYNSYKVPLLSYVYCMVTSSLYLLCGKIITIAYMTYFAYFCG